MSEERQYEPERNKISRFISQNWYSTECKKCQAVNCTCGEKGEQLSEEYEKQKKVWLCFIT